jgi:hypothetical protein
MKQSLELTGRISIRKKASSCKSLRPKVLFLQSSSPILTQLRCYTINEDGSERLVSFSEQEEEAASTRRFCRSFIE